MILPYLCYGIEAWFGAASTDSNKISVIQKKSLRAVHSLPYNAHTNEFFKSDNILKVQDLYKLNLCSLVFRYTQPMVNQPLAARFQSASSVHAHNTRNNQNFVIPRYNLTKSQSCFLFKATHAWNFIPTEIQNSESLKSFKDRLRLYYCSLY